MDWDNPWIVLHKLWIHALRNNPWIVCANCGSTLCATQSQATQTKGTGRNCRAGLRLAAQDNVRDLYLGLGSYIVVFGVWGKCLIDHVGPGTIHGLSHGLSQIHGLRITNIQ